MKYILTVLTAVFAFSACSTTTGHNHATCPHGKGKTDECCVKGKADACCATKPAKKK
jgi:hypothetical protein